MELALEELATDDFPVVVDWIDPGVFKIFSSPVDDTQLMRLLSASQDDIQTDIGMKAVDRATGNTVGLIHAVIDRTSDRPFYEDWGLARSNSALWLSLR